MKKILAFMMAVLFVLSLCACSAGGTATTTVQEIKEAVSSPDEFTVDANSTSDEKVGGKYTNDLLGLCEYMADKNCIYDFVEVKEDEAADPVVMKAEVIGADEGYKYTYTYDGGTVVVELYSYSDFDNSWYKQAKEEGKVTISTEIDNGTVDVILSDSGKYLMVYSDSKNRTDREEAVVAVFKSFDKA